MFKKFLQYIFYSLLSFIFFLILIIVIAALTMGPNVKDDSLLALNIAGPLLEEGPQGWKERLFMGDVLTIRDIIASLEKAKKDDRIKGLLVSTFNAQMGFGKSQDLRGAIKDFAAKKPVYAYLEDADTLEYYVCSAAPKVFMPPSGEGGINLMGLRAEVPFFKGTLDKLGIIAEMDHIGEYKSASEIWTREHMSDAHRESTTAVLDSLYNRITADIAKDRGLTQEAVKKIVDQGPMVRDEIKTTGLVTGLKYRDELDETIKKELKLDELHQIGIQEYKEPTFSESFANPKNKIAIIYASGTITPGESAKGYSEEYVGSRTISQAIRDARKDDSVKSIVLRVDSPGGSAIASDIIWREVVVAQKKKPVVVSMSDVAASGGYYISMGAAKIFAQPSTITGSIGVVYGKFYLKGLYDKIGITKDIIKRGEHADMYSDYTPFEEEEWQIIHKHMQAIYDAFTAKAAEGRNKTQTQIDEVGQGRVWTGEQALTFGLVDQLGGFQAALQEAKKLAKISDKEDVGYVVYPAKKGSFGDMISGSRAAIELPDELTTLLAHAKLAEREHVLLLMPYRFAVK